MAFAPITSPSIEQWQSAVDQASQATGVPKNILSALISVESAGQPYAIGSNGEQGLTQLSPQVAQTYNVNPLDPLQNVMGGASYLADLYKRFGSWPTALSAYNSGSPTSPAGASYANKVLGLIPGASGSAASPAEPAAGATPILTTPVGNVGITGYGVAAVLIVLLVVAGVWGLVKEA